MYPLCSRMAVPMSFAMRSHEVETKNWFLFCFWFHFVATPVVSECNDDYYGGAVQCKICNMYYVYVLLCGDHKHYIGYTENISDRLKRHQNCEVFSTKSRQPVKLIFYEAFKHRLDAKRREGYLKTTAGNRALKLMLRKYYQNQSYPTQTE